MNTPTPKPPPKFEFQIGKIRFVVWAQMGATKTYMKFCISGVPAVDVRFTAARAQQFSQWLNRYAEWSGQIPNQGGR